MSADSPYDFVERIFEDGTHCADCPHYHEYYEPRGEFWGVPCRERVADCAVLEGKVNPQQCPALYELQNPTEA